MLRNSLIALLAFGGLTLLLLMPQIRGDDPQSDLPPAEQQQQFRVNVDTDDEDGVRIRAGQFDIQIRRGKEDPRSNAATDSSEQFLRAAKLIGVPVLDLQHQEIGRIDDVVVDLRSGTVRYMAISRDTVLRRTKLFAVPWSRFKFPVDQQGKLKVVVTLEAETLQRAPGFVRNRWPESANRRWQQEVDVFYGVYVRESGVQARFETAPDPLDRIEHLERVSQLNDFPVISDESERRIGGVSGLIVNTSTGQIAYAVLRLDNTISSRRSQRFPVPFDRLDFDIEDGKPCLELEMDIRRMLRAPRFLKNNWPDFRKLEYRSQLERFYSSDDDD